jgi:hypothetical protein
VLHAIRTDDAEEGSMRGAKQRNMAGSRHRATEVEGEQVDEGTHGHCTQCKHIRAISKEQCTCSAPCIRNAALEYYRSMPEQLSGM